MWILSKCLFSDTLNPKKGFTKSIAVFVNYCLFVLIHA